MILKLTITHSPGAEPIEIAAVDITVKEAVTLIPSDRYLLECRDEAGKRLGRAVKDGLVVRHVMDVAEEPDC